MSTVLRTPAELLAIAVNIVVLAKEVAPNVEGGSRANTTVTENRKVGTQYSGL